MGYLKRMARDNGQVVIASIHQPRSAIWSLFDTVRGAQGPLSRPHCEQRYLSKGARAFDA
jgi:hypothetical protein